MTSLIDLHLIITDILCSLTIWNIHKYIDNLYTSIHFCLRSVVIVTLFSLAFSSQSPCVFVFCEFISNLASANDSYFSFYGFSIVYRSFLTHPHVYALNYLHWNHFIYMKTFRHAFRKMIDDETDGTLLPLLPLFVFSISIYLSILAVAVSRSRKRKRDGIKNINFDATINPFSFTFSNSIRLVVGVYVRGYWRWARSLSLSLPITAKRLQNEQNLF